MTAAPAQDVKFSLRDLIRETVETSGAVDPGEVADKVLAQVPESHIREALAETLRTYVVKVFGETRLHNAEVGPSRAGMVRDWYKSWLRQPMFTGQEWKALGECDVADLRGAVAERREHAERTFAIAKQLEAVADELAMRKVTYVNQLPEDVVARLTGRATS